MTRTGIMDHHTFQGHNRGVPLALQPGMGLPLELWLYIIKSLQRDPFTLVSCALTCRTFRRPAQRLINVYQLKCRSIKSTTYDDINELVGEVSGSSGNGRRIHQLTVEGASFMPILPAEVAVSVIPLRLSRQLTKLQEMCINGITNQLHFNPSTWRLYGRAFSSVTSLKLNCILFPSFVDFASLITSFSTLSSLSLREIRCRNHAAPLSIAKPPSKRVLKLQLLDLGLVRDDEGWFMMMFSAWFFKRCDSVLGSKLTVDDTVPSHPSGCYFLGRAREYFRILEIKCGIVGPARIDIFRLQGAHGHT